MSAAAKTPRTSAPSPRSAAKLWLFRAITAVAFPALILAGLEVGLRVAGFGHPAGFLIPDVQPGYYRTNPDFTALFLPRSFDLRPLNFRVALRKPPNTVRIVVLGESAAQGIPVPAFAFAAQLRAQLRARYPGKDVEVLNTGIVAIDSHVVRRIARDLAAFSPDLFVVYLGNNEVVGPFGPGCAYLSKMPPPALMRLMIVVRSSRVGQLVAAVLDWSTRRGPPPPEWGGMAMFVDNAVRGDDPRLEAVYRNFEANLQDIVRTATDAGAKTLLCTVVSNLKDCAPLLSLHRPGLSEAELAAWRRAFERGRIEWLLGEAAAARTDLQEALRIDPLYADAAFMLGSLELQAGDLAAAREHLVAASHWDALRFRPDFRINEAIRSVARRNAGSVGFLDAAITLGSDPASTVPPAGRELLFEHVHFDWNGNYQLGRLLAERAEATLFGGKQSTAPWLDSMGCAAALAHTKHERISSLQHIASIVQNPPFTNQLTYAEDQARLAQHTAWVQTAANTPAELRRSAAVAAAAVAADPANPALAKIAEEINDDLGDVAGALAEARRARSLQPESFALATDEAIKLSRLGRFDEAEKLLQKTARGCPPRDLAIMAPAFADFYTRTKRFEEGRRWLDGVIALRPNDRNLPLLRGRLAKSAGDTAAAEREYRAILAFDPANQNALEALVALLAESNQTAAAEEASLAAAERQPRNQTNNLRAALIAEARGDEAQATKLLLAAERSGPVTSAVELRLARKLFGLKRLDEALTHLAEAKRISAVEGDPATAVSISEVIENIRSQMR